VNYYEAHQILNEVKDGVDHPVELICHALFLTGDTDLLRGEDCKNPIDVSKSDHKEQQSP